MQVEEWPIGKVKPYENNPRNNDDAVDLTAKSIQEFGWQQPIVIDKDGVVIVGHTRLKAAKKLNLDKVPVVMANKLNDGEIKAYRLADNKTGERADWNFDRLKEEAQELDGSFQKDFRLGSMIPKDGVTLEDLNETVENERLLDKKYRIDVIPDNVTPKTFSDIFDEITAIASELKIEVKEVEI